VDQKLNLQKTSQRACLMAARFSYLHPNKILRLDFVKIFSASGDQFSFWDCDFQSRILEGQIEFHRLNRK